MSKTLTPAVQESLLAVALFDKDPKSAAAVFALAEPKAFDPYYAELAAAARDYHDKYKRSPGEHTLDIVDTLCTRHTDREKIYRQLYASIMSTKDGVNAAYVMEQAGSFARYQRMKRGMAAAADALEKGDTTGLHEAEAALAHSIAPTANLEHIGTRLTDPAALAFLEEDEAESFPTGIKELDAVNAGPARGELWIAAGGSNTGKSWLLVHLGKMGLLNRKRVLHITLEMSEKKVLQRYMMNLFSVTKREATVEVQKLEKDELGRFVDFNMRTIEGRPFFSKEGIHGYLSKKLKAMKQRPTLIVKQFPTGQLTLRQLDAYLDMLEVREKFIPDIIMVDYVDLMHKSNKEHRHALTELTEGLRGIAVQRNCAMVTVSQINRQGDGAKRVNRSHVAEASTKFNTADIFVMLSKTKAEETLGLCRLFLEKSRNDRKNFEVLLTQAYAMGCFCLDSAKMVGSSYWPMVKEAAPDSDDEGGEE